MKYLTTILFVGLIISGIAFKIYYNKYHIELVEKEKATLEINNLIAESSKLEIVYQDSIYTIQEKLGLRVINLKDSANVKLESYKRININLTLEINTLKSKLIKKDDIEEVYAFVDSNQYYNLSMNIHYLKGKKKVTISDLKLTANATIEITSVTVDPNGTALITVKTKNPLFAVSGVYSADNITLSELTKYIRDPSNFKIGAGLGIQASDSRREFSVLGKLQYKKYEIVLGLGETTKSISFIYEF